jgi:hypothetical protein
VPVAIIPMSTPDVSEKRYDRVRHHWIQVSRIVHDTDVREFRLLFGSQIRKDACAEGGRGFARVEHFEVRNVWPSRDTVPTFLSTKRVGIKPRLFGDFAPHTASKIDHSANYITWLGHSRRENNFASIERVGVHYSDDKISIAAA